MPGSGWAVRSMSFRISTRRCRLREGDLSQSDRAKAWMGRGNIQAQFKQYRDALAAYDRSIELDPGSAHIWMGRAEVLAPLSRYDEASRRLRSGAAAKAKPRLCLGHPLRPETIRLRLDESGSGNSATFRYDTAATGAWGGRRFRFGQSPCEWGNRATNRRCASDHEPPVFLGSAVNWVRVYASYPKPFTHVRAARAGENLPRLHVSGFLPARYRQGYCRNVREARRLSLRSPRHFIVAEMTAVPFASALQPLFLSFS